VALEAKVSGVVISAQLQDFQARFGEAVMDQVRAALPADIRDEFALVTAMSSIRCTSIEKFYEVASKVLNIPAADLHTETAVRVTGRTVTSVWRVLLRIATDDILVARSPSLFKKAYPQGRLEVMRSGKGFAEVRVVDWPEMSEFAVRGLRVGVESTLRAAGRKDPKGSARKTADGASFRFDWVV
jgi:hypothetical protein